MRINWMSRMRFGTVVISLLFTGLLSLTVPLYPQAIIVDHTCTDITKIPSSWINAAKTNLRCSYGHTSHGSQLITGMTAIRNHPGSGSQYNFNTSGAVQAGVLSVDDYTPSGDLGNPNRTEWEARTRAYLDGPGSDRNVVLWSWCGQVSSASSANITTYLDLMDGLEQDYPGVTFVYMTGHLDGSGTGGNLHLRNEQIRNFCSANNKILFDFADIESYDPDGNYFLNLNATDTCNYTGGNWATEWLAANPGSYLEQLTNNCGSCAHSQRLNCVLKGSAAWWLFARIAGWNGNVSTSPTLTVTSPNGGEDLTVGDSHTITWVTTGTVGNVKVEYSTNNGGDWSTITDSTANDGSHSWTIPNSPSTECLVRIGETDGSPTDTSNAEFTISSTPPPPTLTVTSPNGGEELTVGNSHNIAWSSSGTVGNVIIEYSTDNGAGWSTVISSTANDGSYSWTVPNTPSTQCLVRISDTGGTPTDTSNAVFTISSTPPDPAVTVTSPNGGEVLTIGNSYKITWDSTGAVGNLYIEYSTDNGAGWSAIISSTANDGCYSWTVPNTPSTKCLVRVRDTGGSPSDVSNAVFTISNTSTASTITLTSPNGAENWFAGAKQNITWTSTGTIDKIRIEYSVDDGKNWSTVVSKTANTGGYLWKIPNRPSPVCRVRVSDKYGSASDTSDGIFTITGDASNAALTLLSPNGGEQWAPGTTHDITWTSTGTVANIAILYSTDYGKTWKTVISSTANDGRYSWLVPNTPSTKCKVKIRDAADGRPYDYSSSPFTITGSTGAVSLALNRTQLNFGASTSGIVTSPQCVLVEIQGGACDWTVTDDASWLTVSKLECAGTGTITASVDASGLEAGSYQGTITVACDQAVNSPQTVTVKLKVYERAECTAPFGDMGSPDEKRTHCSSIPVTGWVLDDIEVKSVRIYNGDEYIGDATLVEGARPDVEAAFPDAPLNYRAGWGYMLLTNGLPRGGNGTYTIYATAVDAEGNSVSLGSKTITVNNSNAVKPFGALDAPGQGGTASGNRFINWGWVLTPKPNCIPTDGSTISVYVDGQKIGQPKYNIYRADIAGLFPNYLNCNGAVGYFVLDTTALSNGVHTIQWNATDDGGNNDGIGSRYFTVQNTETRESQNAKVNANVPAREHQRVPVVLHGQLPDQPGRIPLDYVEPVEVKRGFHSRVERETVFPDDQGMINVEMEELGLLELHVGGVVSRCYFVSNGQHRPLPAGSSYDVEKGVFYWQPGPGFVGRYEFVLLVEKPGAGLIKKKVKITIGPKGSLSAK